MTSLTLAIVVVFIMGYLCIALDEGEQGARGALDVCGLLDTFHG